MKKVTIYGRKHTHNTGGYDPEDSWSRDSTETGWSIRGCGEFVPVKYQAFDDIETDLTGDLYALYAVHSSGDSFGHDSGAYFQLIWVFDKLDMAQAAMKTIQDHADWYRDRHGYRPKKTKDNRFKDEYSVEVDIGKGKPMSVYASWNGFFESLNEIDIYQFRIAE